MAGHMGHITSPLTGRVQRIPRAGFLPENTAENVRRWRKWRRFLLTDIAVGVFGNLFTTMMCCLLTYALLFPEGRWPTSEDPVGPQMAFFGGWGPVGGVIFLIVATAFLSDTWMTTIDAVSRVHTDVTIAYVPGAHRRSPQFWYWVYVMLAAGISMVTLPFAAPGDLILASSVIGFVGTVTFTVSLCIWHHWILPPKLPPPFRPSRLGGAAIAFSTVTYLLLAVAYIYVLFFQSVD